MSCPESEPPLSLPPVFPLEPSLLPEFGSSRSPGQSITRLVELVCVIGIGFRIHCPLLGRGTLFNMVFDGVEIDAIALGFPFKMRESGWSLSSVPIHCAVAIRMALKLN
jgi:hypothetical protein